MESAIPITQLALSLVGAVGVGNFILIVIVLFLIVNAPMIVDRIIQHRHISKIEKKNNEYLNFIQTKVAEIHDLSMTLHNDVLSSENFIQSTIKETAVLKEILVSDEKEAAEERYLISETLGKMLTSLESIINMMRNVISEKDTMSLFAIKVGILDNFKNILINKINNATEVFSGAHTSELSVNLENEINSAWSDLKVELDVFSTPIKMGRYLSKYDESLWESGGMFRRVINLATSDLNAKRKMETISRQLDIGLRKIHNDLNSFLLDKNSNFKEGNS